MLKIDDRVKILMIQRSLSMEFQKILNQGKGISWNYIHRQHLPQCQTSMNIKKMKMMK